MAKEYSFKYDLRKNDGNGMLIDNRLANKVIKKLKRDAFYLGVQNEKTNEEYHTFQSGEERIEIRPHQRSAEVYGKSKLKIQQKVSTLEKLTGIIFH